MTSPEDFKKIFFEASQAVLEAWKQSGKSEALEATPEQLVDAIEQFIAIYEKMGVNPVSRISIDRDNISLIGEQTINCLADLAYWAEQFALPSEAGLFEEMALSVAQWVIRQQGEIRSLEAMVNLLAEKANQTDEPEILSALFHVIRDVIRHTAEDLKSDTDKSDPNRPWRMLNLNYAIVATKTSKRDLMVQAFDTLGQNFPEECPEFFEEGLRQSEKPVYGPEIREIMTEYFRKWTVLH